MKIAFVLNAKFPTQKAYGITTLNTAVALMDKSHEVKIFCLKSDYNDSDYKVISSQLIILGNSIIGNLLYQLSIRGMRIINKFAWKLSTVILIRNNLIKLQEFNPEIIWLRSPELAYYLLRKLPSKKIVLEVHSDSGKKYFKKFQNFKSNLLLCPINQSNYEFVKEFGVNQNIVLAPMSINISSLETEKRVNKYVENLKNKKGNNLKIGYVGKFSPGGYSKGIEDLIELAQVFKAIDSNNMVTLVGGQQKEIAEVSHALEAKNLSFKQISIEPHVNHTTAIKKLSDFDILVLPAPDSNNYNGTPLKAAEYCASGRIVIAAKVQIYEDFFDETYQPFWYKSKNPLSLFEAITDSLKTIDLKNHLLSGITFASKFSWEKRVDNIINYLNLRF